MPKNTRTPVDDPAVIDAAGDDEEIVVVEEPEHGAEPNEGAESLKEQLAEMTRQKDAAVRQAAEKDAEVKRVAAESTRHQSELEDSRLATIQNAIAATEGKKKELRARLIAAKASADFETEADLSLEVAQVTTELQRLNEGKSLLENRISDERERAKSPPPSTATDPLERAVENMSPRAAAWVRSHSEVVFDPVRNAELVLADKLAQRAGLDPASDAYFAHMDAQMGYGGATHAERPAERRQAPPAAPVSRGGAMDAPTRPGQVSLSRAEREMADAWGWSYARYAQEKLKVAAESSTTH